MPERGVVYNDGFINLVDCKIKNTNEAGIIVSDSGTLYMAQSEIENCKFGIICRGYFSVVLTNFINLDIGIYSESEDDVSVTMSNFHMIRQYGVYNKNDQIAVSAQFNYWNSLQGPSIYNYETGLWEGSGTRIWGKVDYTNWSMEASV